MKKSFVTKKMFTAKLISLIMLILAMAMCCTFAWFTSTARNDGNTIVIGELKAALFNENDNTDAVFSSELIWEPGFSVTKKLTAVNQGNIEFVYAITLENLVDNIDENMLELFDIYINNAFRGTLEDYQNGTNILHVGRLIPSSSEAFTITISFAEEATETVAGNEITFDIVLNATQIAQANTYVLFNAPVKAGKPAQVASEAAVVDIPASAIEGLMDNEQVTLTTTITETSAPEDSTKIEIDLQLIGSTAGNITDFASPVTVTFYVQKGLSNVVVIYDGENVSPTDITYDPITGKVTFKTNHFSKFVLLSDAAYVTNATELTEGLTSSTVSYVVLANDITIDTMVYNKLFYLNLNGFTLTTNTFVVNCDDNGDLAIKNGTICVPNIGNYIINAPNAKIDREYLKHDIGGMLNGNTNANGNAIFDPRTGTIAENVDGSLTFTVSTSDGPYFSIGKIIPWTKRGLTVLTDVEIDPATFSMNPTLAASFGIDMTMQNTSGVYGTERRVVFAQAKNSSVITVKIAHTIPGFTFDEVTLPALTDGMHHKFTVGLSWYDDGNGFLNCMLFVLNEDGSILQNQGKTALWLYDEGKFNDKLSSFNGTSANIGAPGALWFLGSNSKAIVRSVKVTNNVMCPVLP